MTENQVTGPGASPINKLIGKSASNIDFSCTVVIVVIIVCCHCLLLWYVPLEHNTTKVRYTALSHKISNHTAQQNYSNTAVLRYLLCS
jgi:hypothetical protein